MLHKTRCANVTSSTFFGGPERQMLGLALALAPKCERLFCRSAREGGAGASSTKPEPRASWPPTCGMTPPTSALPSAS